MITASAAAFFPMPYAPVSATYFLLWLLSATYHETSGRCQHLDAQVYSAAKGGIVNFVRAFAKPLEKRNIRLLALCPQFISTALVAPLSPPPPPPSSGRGPDNLSKEGRSQALSKPALLGSCLPCPCRSND